MTANQINAQKQKEDARHNAYSEQLELAQIRESVRHNLRTEKEQKRHNMNVESISRVQNYETARHNVKTEGITSSYNEGNLALGFRNADIASRNADVNAINAQTNRYGYELNKMMAPYNIQETQSRTALNKTNVEMRPYETGSKLIDTASRIISIFH